MIRYRINGLNFTSFVVGQPRLNYRIGRTANFMANNGVIEVANDNNLFSPEKTTSILYKYRNKYSDIKIIVDDDETGQIYWHGIVDNIVRNPDATTQIQTIESIINLLDVQTMVYKSGDGFVGDRAFAGSTATPAEHQLAILRRFLDDEVINLGSFLMAIEKQNILGLQVDCQVNISDNHTPINFLKMLCMDICGITIYNNKVTIDYFEPFLGNYGYLLNNDLIYDISSIQRSIKKDVFSRYSIQWDNGGSPATAEDSIGDSGVTTALTSTSMTDNSTGHNDWTPNELIGQYVVIDNQVLYITGNNKTQIFFTGYTGGASPKDYTIMENNNIYSANYSVYPIKLSAGIVGLGLSILTNQKTQKLEIGLSLSGVLDFLRPGDNITLNLPDEGIINEPFCVEEINIAPETKLITIKAYDDNIYDKNLDYDLGAELDAPTIYGYRIEDKVYLWWLAVDNAIYYKIYYSTNPSFPQYTTFTTSTPSQASPFLIDKLLGWANYYFWVKAVNLAGLEGQQSNVLYFARVSQYDGYIDGTKGYFGENYSDWGLLEFYYFAITYKNLNYDDISYIKKSVLNILDASQVSGVNEVAQGWATDKTTGNYHGVFRRNVGYLDLAGTSNYLPEYVYIDPTTRRIKNGLSQKFRLGDVIYDPDEEFIDSENWYLRDAANNFYNYWFDTGYMLDPTNADYLLWFKNYKISRAMGIYESGDCTKLENSNIITATTKEFFSSWLTDTENGQWENYYVYLPSSSDLKYKWFRIQANTENTLEIKGLTAAYTGRYIINAQASSGFDGIFLDDVWDHLYDDGAIADNTDSGIGESVGGTWVTDNDKSWETNQWVGYQIKINNSGSLFTITDNTDTTINFTGPNPQTGVGISYEIKSYFEWINGKTYAEAMADFIQNVTEYIELLSYRYYRNYDRLSDGIIILNTWCEEWANYQEYVNHLTMNYQHYVMFEALQSTWDMANEVTKQYIVRDWQVALERYNNMKITNTITSAYVRLTTLGYPHTQQMYLSLLIGAIILCRYSTQLEDLVSGGNVVLNQIYYDMIQAANQETTGGYTIGKPAVGYETDYDKDIYDPYGLYVRKMDGAWLIFNPSRKHIVRDFTFGENVVGYHTGQLIDDSETTPVFCLPRSMQAFFRQETVTGKIAAEFLSTYLSFTYYDCNAAWIVFTETGAALIDTNSIWIENGHGHHNVIVLDGSATVPEGTIQNLFHAGDGAATAVIGYDAEVEAIVGDKIHSQVTLTSKTIFAVVWIEDHDNPSHDLVIGTDYIVNYGLSDNTVSGKGKWDTKIYFLSNQSGKNLDVYYYEQGLNGSGYPDGDYTSPETGILYRKNSGFKLLTGDINQIDCTTELVEGTDYYCIPEPTRWKWDYRFTLNSGSGIAGDYDIYLKNIATYKTKTSLKTKGLHWGIIDSDNVILVDPTKGNDQACNGFKADYDSITITKPKILVYGFYGDPRDASFETIAPASRVYNSFRVECELLKLKNIYYDDVQITGFYDGVSDPEDGGMWGSIRGVLNEKGWTDPDDTINITSAVAYFDIVIICDNFLEGSSGSPSGDTQYCSWLDEIDYKFIRAIKNKSVSKNKLVIDQRFSAGAFCWWGGKEPIDNMLINKGADLMDDGVTRYSDVTDIWGILTFAGISYSDLYDANTDLYLDENGVEKFNDSLSVDLRIFDNVDGITDHYILDAEDNRFIDPPVYNVFEQGGSFLTYVPVSKYYRTGKLLEKSNLYIKQYDLLQYNDTQFITYEQLDLDSIILKRLPAIIFSRKDNFFVQSWSPLGCGNRVTTQLCRWIYTTGTMKICPLFDNLQNFTGKYINFDEARAKLSVAFTTYSAWLGFKGFYININSNEYGWVAYQDVFLNPWMRGYGGYYPANEIIPFQNEIECDGWNDEMQASYPVHTDRGGFLPTTRTYPMYEGKIKKIEKDIINENYAHIYADFDISMVKSIQTELSGRGISNINYWSAMGGAYQWGSKFIVTDQTLVPNQYAGHYIYIKSINPVQELAFGPIWANTATEIRVKGLQMTGAELSFGGEYYFDIRTGSEKWYCTTMLTNYEENCAVNLLVQQLNYALQRITVVLPRAIEDLTNPAGYTMLHAVSLGDDSAEMYDVYGGIIPKCNDKLNIEIANTFIPICSNPDEFDADNPSTPDNMLTEYNFEGDTDYKILSKPAFLVAYEIALKNKIKEFAYDFNTGMLTGYAFYRDGVDGIKNCPLVCWGGVSLEDIKRMIDNFVGSKLTFENLTVAADKDLYLYYNQKTDMLQIYEEDVGSPVSMPFYVQGYTTNEIVQNTNIDYLIFDETNFDETYFK